MRIAVISAVYNEEKNISRLVEALLNQTRRPDEIILIDDGSNDTTRILWEEAQEEREDHNEGRQVQDLKGFFNHV